MARTRKRPGTSELAKAIVRCAIYTRKSVDKGLDREFTSLDAQRESCEAYIRSRKEQGWELVTDRYDDGGYSGKDTDRPAFQRLMADVAAGKIDVVVVYKVDRLSRSLLDFAQVMSAFEAAGCAFVAITQNFSTADAMGRLTLHILMSFAEFEREMIGERTRDKIRAARRKGKWTGGTVPFGYLVRDRRLVIDEIDAPIVREMFDSYLVLRSALAVARGLTERGCLRRTRTGARPWTKIDVLRILANPVYAGYIPHGDELHEGEHAALIDRPTFAQVRALLADRGARPAPVVRNPEYVLRGLVRCARCGAAMTPASTRKGAAEYRYYRCTTRDKQGRAGCGAPQIAAGALEEQVASQLGQAVAQRKLAAKVTERAGKRLAQLRAQLERDLVAVGRDLDAHRAEVDRLTLAIGEAEAGAAAALTRRLEERTQVLGAAEARRAELERRLRAAEHASIEAGWVARHLADLKQLWGVLTPTNQGRLLRAVIARVDVDRDQELARVTLRSPTDVEVNGASA
jgi:DNA invertase Pin-like site-specific DNA recombinase